MPADNGGEVFTVALLATAENATFDDAADSDVLTDARGRMVGSSALKPSSLLMPWAAASG